MQLSENASCPVCNRIFQKGDDIVFCPECGTPHHRECYKAVGHCVNRGLHASGYSYYDEQKKNAQVNQTAEDTKNETSENQNDVNQNEARNPFEGFLLPDLMSFDSVYEKDDQTICGESVADYAATIKTNVPRFINVFKEFEYRGRKASWNWGAFLFGSLYLFYRKMYKQAIGFMTAFIGVIYASTFAISKLAPKYVEGLSNLANLLAQNKATNDDFNALLKISDFSTAITISRIAFAAIIILRIVQALLADRIYKSTISDFIKSVNAQLKDGASFVQSPLFGAQGSDLSQSQLKRYYLSRRGGTNLFLPLTAGFAIYSLISIASQTLIY
ncbi:MAG: DUF2628 domain-containing protein [Eubacterium sp.]|nr:DUF2628 domain-containing protein [Eubacterium sp.]